MGARDPGEHVAAGWDAGSPQRRLKTIELFPLNNEKLLAEIDRFRNEYELIHGETGPGPFTSQLSAQEQQWMSANCPKAYFDGFPPFVKQFYERYWSFAAAMGRLEELPGVMIEVYAALRRQRKS